MLDFVKYSLILYATFYIFRMLNNYYFEINQVCPYKTDFDCLYRYLICEGDCSDPTIKFTELWLDFTENPRRDGFFLQTRLFDIVSKLVLISIIFSAFMAMGILKKGARIYIILIAMNVYYLRTYRDGIEHGDYTKVIGNWLIILITGLTALFTVVIILGKINSKGKGYAWGVFITIFATVMFAGYGLIQRVKTSCNDWDKGLYGERIDNTVNCQFDKPGFCLYEFLGDAFDYNEWFFYTCQDRQPHWDQMREKYPNASRVGFPTTKNMTKKDRQFNATAKWMDNHTVEVTEENEKDFEVVLHRTFNKTTKTYGAPAWLDINIQRDEELVEQRSKLVSDSLAENVLVIYIDTLSRAAAMRKLPETMKLFEEMNTHQFFKYHSITPYTLGNMYPMFYGIERPLPIPFPTEKKSFIHQYHDKGFITGRALSHCAISAINSGFDYGVYIQIDEARFDHEGLGWSCDVNTRAQSVNELTTGPISVLKRCAYGKEVSEYVIDYGKKFWETYKDQKRFLWLDFLDFHEHSFSHGKYLDGHLSRFLREMDLKDTVVMMVSDHGHHLFFNPALRNFQSGHIERAAPTLFMKLPENLEKEYGDGVKENKQQIVTAFDVYNLFMAIPNPSKVNDTLLYPIPEKKKGCDFAVVDQDCHCRLSNTTNSTNSTSSLNVSQKLL